MDKTTKLGAKIAFVIILIIALSILISTIVQKVNEKPEPEIDYGWVDDKKAEVYPFVVSYLKRVKPHNAWYIDKVKIDNRTPIYLGEEGDYCLIIDGSYLIPDKEFPEVSFMGEINSFVMMLQYDRDNDKLFVGEVLPTLTDHLEHSDDFTDEEAIDMYNRAVRQLESKFPQKHLYPIENTDVYKTNSTIVNGYYYIREPGEKYKGIIYEYRVTISWNKYYERYDYNISRDYGRELY